MNQIYPYFYKVILVNKETKLEEVALKIPIHAENKQQALNYVTSDSITSLLKEGLRNYTKDKYKDAILIEIFVVKNGEPAKEPTYQVFTSLKKLKQ